MNKLAHYLIGIFTWLLILPGILPSCRSAKQSQADKDYKAAVAEEKLIIKMRQRLPCDTSTVVITKTDTAFVFLTDTTYSHDTAFVTKTKVVTNTIYKTATVVDSAYGKLWQDRYEQAGYLLQNANDQSNKLAAENAKKDTQISELKPWKAKAIWTWVTFGVGLIGILYLKFKP